VWKDRGRREEDQAHRERESRQAKIKVTKKSVKIDGKGPAGVSYM